MAATTTTKRRSVDNRSSNTKKTTKKFNDTKSSTTTTITNKKNDENVTVSSEEIRRVKEKMSLVAEEHLPPLGLAFVVLLCSGFLLVLNLRDFATTGKNLLGDWDESLLVRLKKNLYFLFLNICPYCCCCCRSNSVLNSISHSAKKIQFFPINSFPRSFRYQFWSILLFITLRVVHFKFCF